MSTDHDPTTPAHLTKHRRFDGRGGRRVHETADPPREYYCRDCGRRVTQARNEEGEYGHLPTCRHHFQLEWSE